jgi:hypothetical protein
MESGERRKVMNILLRVLANLWCVVMTAWLFCESMPALILTSHVVSGNTLLVLASVVGVVDLAVAAALFIVVNIFVSGMVRA